MLLRIDRPAGDRHGTREDRDQADRELDEPAGDLLQAPGRAAQEGQRARRAVRRARRRRHLLQHRQDVRVLQPCLQVSYYERVTDLVLFCSSPQYPSDLISVALACVILDLHPDDELPK